MDGPERQQCLQATQPSKSPTGTPNRKLVGLVDSKSVRGRLVSYKRATVGSPHRVQDQRIRFEKCGEAHDRGQG